MSSLIFPMTSLLTSCAAALMACLMALRFARPCVTMQFPRKTKQRRSAIGLVIEPFAQLFERGGEQRGAEFGHQVSAEQRVAHDTGEIGDHALSGLEDDVSDETVGDDHVGNVVEKIASLNVADESHGCDFEQAAPPRGRVDYLCCAPHRRRECRPAGLRR